MPYMSQRKKPEILNTSLIAESRLFTIQAVDLRFANGTEARYERIVAPGTGAVMVIPFISATEVLMIREYSVGSERYELVFPKGVIDAGETPLAAANRELMEETGYGAAQLSELKTVTIAPGYLTFKTTFVIARDLYPHKLEGDEPEQLEIVRVSLDDTASILASDELTEARSIAGLLLAGNRGMAM